MYGENMSKKEKEKYAGQWLVVVNDKIVWNHKYPRGLRNQVQKYNKENITPLIFRVFDGTLPLS